MINDLTNKLMAAKLAVRRAAREWGKSTAPTYYQKHAQYIQAVQKQDKLLEELTGGKR